MRAKSCVGPQSVEISALCGTKVKRKPPEKDAKGIHPRRLLLVVSTEKRRRYTQSRCAR